MFKKKNATIKENQAFQYLKHFPEFTLRFISINYPLNGRQIIKYADKLKWDSQDQRIEMGDIDDIPFEYPLLKGISDNQNIPWSIELISKFQNKLNWKRLSRNNSLNWWSSDLIREFKNKWDWKELSSNMNLHLSADIIEEFKDYWIWESENFHYDISYFNVALPMYTGICANRTVEWDGIKIERFFDLINWDALSLNPNLKWFPDELYRSPIAPWEKSCLFDKYFKYWNFKNLSYNRNLGTLIRPLKDSLKPQVFLGDQWDWKGLSKNPSLPWTESFVNDLEDRIDWERFSRNLKFEWSDNFISKYLERLDWRGLSANESLPWSIDLIEKYICHWDWAMLSLNPGLPWNKELIRKYENRWDWDLLSEHGVPWDKKLLKYFENQVNWKKISFNDTLNLDYSTLLKYEKSLNICFILENGCLMNPKWDINLLRLYFRNLQGGYDNNKLRIELLNNDQIYTNLFSKHITESDSNDIMEYVIQNYDRHEGGWTPRSF